MYLDDFLLKDGDTFAFSAFIKTVGQEYFGTATGDPLSDMSSITLAPGGRAFSRALPAGQAVELGTRPEI